MIIRTKSSGSPSPHQGRSRLSPPQIHHQTQAWLPRLESHPGFQLRGSTLAGPPESALKTFWRDTDTGQPREEERYQYTPDLMTGSRGSHLTPLEGRGTSRQSRAPKFYGGGITILSQNKKNQEDGDENGRASGGGLAKTIERKEKAKKSKVEQRHIQVFGCAARQGARETAL